ncbi:MAG: M48 family metalloprotease [Pseudomonadales bacterium]
MALALLLGATACAVNPVTGRPQFTLISEGQEVQIGQQGAQQVEQSMALVDDSELQEYVSRLGHQLAAASERPELPWSFKVVDDPTPNAFALPGGPIYFTRGMLTLMNSEAQLVSVLGHEIGHITARHSVAQISRAQLAQLGIGIGMVVVPELRPFADLAGVGLNLLMLRYSRDAERQADELGFNYAREQNYDVTEMAEVFAALGRLADLEDRSPLPSWLATHPAPEERVRAIERRAERQEVARDPDTMVGHESYLMQIDGLAYGPNPRNGFFREHRFYHPDLEFQFAVPRGWQTQNLARAVIAASQEQDAVLQLTLAGVADPEAALQRFMGQEGVARGRVERRTINGIFAVQSNFQAQTQQGVLSGRAAFLDYGGNVYQLVAYTSVDREAQYRAMFGDAIDSFAPLEDPEILEVQPATIEIVRLDRDMTLAEFHRQHPSAIPVERLALLNQVEQPARPLPAGTLLKRVRGDPELLQN